MDLFSFLFTLTSLLGPDSGIQYTPAVPLVQPCTGMNSVLPCTNQGQDKLGTRPRNRPFTILVEGNVGAGKSTVLNSLARREGFQVVPEPVQQWQNVSGKNLLEYMMNDGQRWMATFQLYATLTRLDAALNSGKNSPYRVLERSLYSQQYCFVQYLKEEGMLSRGEYALIQKWFDFLMGSENIDLGVDLIIYIRTEPEVLLDRIRKRGRQEESSVEKGFLEKLHVLHENWLIHGHFPLPAQVLVVNGNLDIEAEMVQVYQSLDKLLPSPSNL